MASVNEVMIKEPTKKLNGCDGRLITKIFIATIQVYFVLIRWDEATQIHLNFPYSNFLKSTYTTITANFWLLSWTSQLFPTVWPF